VQEPVDGEGGDDGVATGGAVGTTVIERVRLLERAGDHDRVVLSAPAGYGKTLLARQLARRWPGPVAWCSLSESDGPGGAAAALLAALGAAFPHLGIEPPVVDGTGPARVAWALGELGGPATVVLDNAHVLGPHDDLLERLAGATGEGLRLVVATDADPPPVLLRGIAEGRTVVLGPSDLLLDEAECSQLAGAAGAGVDGAEVRRRSGGWAIAAALAARNPDVDPSGVAGGALEGLDPAVIDDLVVLAWVPSLPEAAFAHAGAIRAAARRNPALLAVDDGRVAARAPLSAALRARARTGNPPGPALAAVDRLERAGSVADALLLAARVDPAGLLQDRLAAIGPGLLDAGRHRLVHDLVTAVPADRRTVATTVIDAWAELGMEQLRPPATPSAAGRDDLLARLALRCEPGSDDALAVAGCRVEALRRRGDPGLVPVALEALAPLPPLRSDTDAAALVHGRSHLARRGLHHLLHGLGVAALFSGDPATITEGRRLCELSFAVAEAAGLDTVPLRAQAAYERVIIGLDDPASALAPLEAGVVALRTRGHPDAANQLVELADLHGRLGRPEAGLPLLEAAREWSDRTGNELVGPSIDLAAAGLRLIADGPSDDLDRDLERAWRALIAAGRLLRAAPALAVRFANAMLDHGDTERAGRWLALAEAVPGGAVQRGYQAAYRASVERRRQYLSGEAELPPVTDDGGPFRAQPAGRVEAVCTLAWDHLRAGDPGPARRVWDRLGPRLGPPWSDRLRPAAPDRAGAPRAGDVERPGLRVRCLCPTLAVERDGRPAPSPTGHAARLLALLVVAGGPVPVESVIEDLWPDADAGAAATRNRFHQVVHRLRRALGIGADGPLRVDAGLVRLDPGAVTSDVWDLRALDPNDPVAATELLTQVRSGFCEAQFAYDETFDEARWELSRRIADAAALALSGPRPGREALAAVADLWDRLPAEPRLGEALADAYRRRGEASLAAECHRRLDGGTPTDRSGWVSSGSRDSS
jgi:DNA-binding SARP family transcriptional activator